MSTGRIGIVAFAFGVPGSIPPNLLIAEFASRAARELNAPIFTQRDVLVDTDVEVKYIEGEELDFPPPTLRIARAAIQWAKTEGFDLLKAVAAKPHLQRCVRDLRAAAKEEGAHGIRVFSFMELEKIPESCWFSSESTQSRTRSRKAWRRRWMP